MKSISLTVVATTLAATAAFQAPAQTARPSTALHEYIPSGFTKESWDAFKAKEKKQKEELMKKNLGRVGPKGFQSRSFQSFQEALERGETTHMLPVEFAKEKLAKGEIKLEDIPYMQRGGNWDNSDVKGARKVRWLQSDKEYASGGFKKSQSISILGEGAGLDWTGKRDRQGPSVVTAGKMSKNYKAPTIAQLKGQVEEKPKKKGWFGF
ncbi:hypothetical protein HJC23_007783 [Cyclotella cryptica]|uniref:Uncharacterized protein n=1 Tax=Cyclotella cryptica TaxID=29204 RepID=A0ABD3R0K7_9STRA|eukprot:CCRYP_000061-RA/>CCRYP_000061-RA protein AED:0.04 eAED:0.04 QI:308/1/1/1/1/1/2/172/208